jgi:hypothetical protein
MMAAKHFAVMLAQVTKVAVGVHQYKRCFCPGMALVMLLCYYLCCYVTQVLRFVWRLLIDGQVRHAMVPTLALTACVRFISAMLLRGRHTITFERPFQCIQHGLQHACGCVRVACDSSQLLVCCACVCVVSTPRQAKAASDVRCVLLQDGVMHVTLLQGCTGLHDRSAHSGCSTGPITAIVVRLCAAVLRGCSL